MGGSLGSTFINSLVGGIAARLVRVCFVVHQMGEKDFTPSRLPGYHTASFITEGLPDIMAAADLVVCRAGANTLAELAALGKPMVLIPLPSSGSRGDQLRSRPPLVWLCLRRNRFADSSDRFFCPAGPSMRVKLFLALWSSRPT
jgi:hypothetical protein